MDQLGSRLKQLSSELRDYLETRIDLLVLNVGDQITQWIGHSIQKIIGLVVIGVGIFFAMIAAAIFIGEYFQNEAIGYLIISVPLLLIGLILALAKPFGIAKTIQKQLMEGILEALDDEKTEKNLALPEPKELEKLSNNE